MITLKRVFFSFLFISIFILLSACGRQAEPLPGSTTQPSAMQAETAAEESTVSAAAKTTAVPTEKETTAAAKVTVKPTEKGTASTAAKPTTAEQTTVQPATTKPVVTTSTVVKPTTTKPAATTPTAAKPTTAKPTETKPTTAKPTGSAASVTVEYGAAALRLVNSERKKAGLEPLAANAELQRCANIRAKEIVQKFSHTRPNGQSCFEINADLVMGENIACGQRTPQEVVNGWMNSPAHRENILRKRFTIGAVGCYYDKTEKMYYWVQLFG